MKRILILCSSLIFLFLTGCGYTAEEKEQMKAYEKQGEKNAVNYISEKYGFEPKVVSVSCEKRDVVAVPDFSPGATGAVFAEMEYDDISFYVYITGEEVSTEGIDNYQFAMIEEDFTERMTELTDGASEEVFLCYGHYSSGEAAENGMISTYYDGSNLREVLTEVDYNYRAVVSFIKEDLIEIQIEMILDELGEGQYLFVSYNSDEAFEKSGNHDYSIYGSPIDYDIEENGYYIKEHRTFSGSEDVYMEYDLQECDGFYFKTQYADESVFLEKAEMDRADNWNGRGFLNARQVMDAYEVISDSNRVDFYIPLTCVETEKTERLRIVLQGEKDGEVNYGTVLTSTSENGEYLTGTLLMRDYEKVIISVFTDDEDE